jgi:hypothetical protein
VEILQRFYSVYTVIMIKTKELLTQVKHEKFKVKVKSSLPQAVEVYRVVRRRGSHIF